MKDNFAGNCLFPLIKLKYENEKEISYRCRTDVQLVNKNKDLKNDLSSFSIEVSRMAERNFSSKFVFYFFTLDELFSFVNIIFNIFSSEAGFQIFFFLLQLIPFLHLMHIFSVVESFQLYKLCNNIIMKVQKLKYCSIVKEQKFGKLQIIFSKMLFQVNK